MQNKNNFSGQNLRGRSFKNQSLIGADFSGCDLRRLDFSFADLTGAKFCNARMGKTTKTQILLIILKSFLGVLGCIIASGGHAILGVFVFPVHDDALSAFGYFAPFKKFQLLYPFLFVTTIIIAVNRNKFVYILWFIIMITGIILFPLFFYYSPIGEEKKVAMSIFSGMFSPGLIFVSIIIMGIGIFVASLTNFLGLILNALLILILLLGIDETTKMFIAGFINTILGFYLGWRANKREEPNLLLLRNWSLKLTCWGGTEFAFANLIQVDFSNTDLKYTRFKNAKFNKCNFQNTRNHHLALFENTPLEPRKVRDLVINGQITDKDFSKLDLRGLVFAGLNLEGFNFSHANLCGADLSHTQMTGAIIESWNIDTETCLDNIDCHYYYYLDKGEQKRMPPEGEEFRIGEFSRIFQKIAHTIDFIAHNEMELAAIKLSVEQVRVESGNNEIHIQAIEEKDGIIVVKVNAPKNEDRGVLYHEVNSLKQEYETRIQLLMSENQIQIGKIEILKEQLKEQRQDLLAAIKPKILIQNSTINNEGILNLGEINGNVLQENI
jgi:uncharacterized protein YjbI with pentapeptide repeats